MTSNLGRELHIWQYLKERLIEQYADLKEDQQTLQDTLEGITNLQEAIEWTVESIAEDEEMLAGIKDRLEALNQRYDRIESRIETKRGLLLEALVKTDQKKIEHPEFTIFRQKGRQFVNILDESAIPTEYTLAQPAKPDKKLIKVAWENNTEVPGTELSISPETLVIRRA